MTIFFQTSSFFLFCTHSYYVQIRRTKEVAEQKPHHIFFDDSKNFSGLRLSLKSYRELNDALVSANSFAERTREFSFTPNVSTFSKSPSFVNESATQTNANNSEPAQPTANEPGPSKPKDDNMVDCLLRLDEDATENLFISVWMGFLAEHKSSCAIKGKKILS